MKINTKYQTKYQSHLPNIKSLRPPVSKKKNFEDGLYCSYVPTRDPLEGASFDFEIFFLCSHVPNCDLRGGASFDPGGASYEQTWLRSTTR